MTHSRLLIGFLLLAMLVTACTTATATPTQPPALTRPPAPAHNTAPTQPPASPVVLKLEGPGGTQALTMNDLKALPAVKGWAGIKSSTGKITIPERFKGVAVDELCKLVGGLGPNTGVSIVAKDGYAMTISYDQIANGDFITYDPGTGDEVKIKDPLKVIIAYEKDGKPLPEDSEGTLRLVGSDLQSKEMVGQIAKVMLLIGAVLEKPTAAATAAPTAASGKTALAVTGAVDKELALTMDALKAVGVVKLSAEHPKKGKQDYEGIRLNALLDQAKVKSNAAKLLFVSSDGYTVEVGLAAALPVTVILILASLVVFALLQVLLVRGRESAPAES